MALNPAIALQVRQPEIMNPGQLLSLQNVAQQSQLGRMQLEDMQQARAEQDQLKGLFNTPGNIDQRTGAVSLEGIQKAYGISPKAAQGMAQQRQVSLKGLAELENVETDVMTKKAKFMRDGLASVTDQPSYDAWRAQGMEIGAQVASKAPSVYDPKWQRRNVMDADKFIADNTPNMQPTDIGGQVVMIDRNANTNPAIKGTVLEKTATPGEKLTDKRAREAAEQDKFGPPQEVTGPDGKPMLVMQNKKTGEMVNANTKQPVSGVGPKIGETAQKQQTGVATVKDAITQYRSALKDFSITDIANPNARARMGTIYNNMLLQAKEAYNLGVLNGPDYMILQTVVTDPTSLKGGITSKAALDDQAKKLDEIMSRVGERVTQTQAGVPNATPVKRAVPKTGHVEDGYRFKGGNPSDAKNWEKV